MERVERICSEYLKHDPVQQKKKPKKLGVGFDDILKRELKAIKEKEEKRNEQHSN